MIAPSMRLFLAALPLCVAACHSENEPVHLTPAEAAASQTPATAATARPGAQTSTPKPAAAQPAPTTGSAGTLQFSTPEGWITETPSSPMRKGQFKLPKQGGDTEDGQLVLFYFGGEGGSKEANVQRWAGQFEQPDGRASMEVLQTSSRQVNGMDVYEADLSGTYVAETMPGSGERVRKENWRMLAAIVTTPDGPYYAKLVGPKGTLAYWEPSFRRFVSSMKSTK